MTVEEILEEMENLLLEAARVPFTNKRVIDEDDLGRLIDELREILPGELMEANRVIAERLRIMEDAQKEAQNIVDQGKNYVHRMADENAITRQAQEQAAEIIQQAQRAANELKGDSLVYADEVFGYLEENLIKALETVRSSHSRLSQNKRD